MAVSGFCAFRIESIGVIGSVLKVLLYHIMIVGFMLLCSASTNLSLVEISSSTLGFSKFSTTFATESKSKYSTSARLVRCLSIRAWIFSLFR